MHGRSVARGTQGPAAGESRSEIKEEAAATPLSEDIRGRASPAAGKRMRIARVDMVAMAQQLR
jgi:hypothetical protein